MDSVAPHSLADLDLPALVASALAGHEATIAAWLRGEPGSWGALAAQAILAARRTLGRRLTDGVRRLVWQDTWDHLTRLRTATPTSQPE